MSSSIDQIRSRQKHLADEIAKLQSEHDDLDIALRVLTRLLKTPDKPPKAVKAAKGKRAKKALTPRPDGIPSTFEMVEKILSDAEKAGKSALTSREILDQINEKYWPGVHRSQILPSIFGFAPKRLTRDGDKWKKKKSQQPKGEGLFAEK
jgi:hypothetical protein